MLLTTVPVLYLCRLNFMVSSSRARVQGRRNIVDFSTSDFAKCVHVRYRTHHLSAGGRFSGANSRSSALGAGEPCFPEPSARS